MKKTDNIKKLLEGYIITLQKDESMLEKCNNKDRPSVLFRIKSGKQEIKKLKQKLLELGE